jgi:hypothetical protein
MGAESLILKTLVMPFGQGLEKGWLLTDIAHQHAWLWQIGHDLERV